MRQDLETWLARSREACPDDDPLPAWVEAEFRRSLGCGILAHGFARARCSVCGHDFLVAFSCKGILCPSCTTRRMAESAAHRVDHVFPQVPVRRQWVLSFPKRLRYFLHRDPARVGRVLGVVLRAREGRLRGCCPGAPATARFGAVTFIQRCIYECLPRSCPRCGAEMCLIAFLTEPASVKPLLAHLGLPSEPPRVAPARAPALEDLDQTPDFDPAEPASVREYECDQTVSW